MQRTLILFKPDCVQRRLVGEVLRRFEARGLRIDGLKFMQVDRALAEEHYAEHRERPFFGGLIEFITASPIVAGVLSGPNAVPLVRKMIGKTDAVEAEPGTIRGDLALSKQNNLIHGSDSAESAAREIALWFRPEELLDYEVAGSRWTTGG
jgi:nucleoside-diphosphate kinase